jgi:RHS repeat-associated protein
VNQSGTVVERNDYYPFGMQMAHNQLTNSASGSDNKRKFGNKELDVMSGLNLYDSQARSYDPTLGGFTTADPLGEDDPDYSPYAYCHGNPINKVDPDGRWVESAWDIFSLGTGVASFVHNVKEGNVGAAIVDGIGIVADAAAVVVPLVPGGVGAGIKAVRTADKVAKVVEGTKTVKTIVKEEGKIYRVPGKNTPSGKPYVGSADDLGKRTKTAKDGRDRRNAEVIGSYPKGEKES